MENRRQTLNRNKTIATGLMVGAALLFIIARSRHELGAWEWVGAFAEAAMVGAFADWFAVVALFRHPLGLPIPHTAIIKNKKETIAGNLADFIRDKFLAPATLTAKLRAYNPAGRLSSYLVDPVNAELVARGMSRVLAESLDFLDDERVQKVVRAALSDQVEKFDLSTSAGVVLDTLRHKNRHQVVLDDLLRRGAAWISTPEAQAGLAVAIDNMIKKEYPMISMFIPNREEFSQGAGEKIVRRLNEYLQEVSTDPEHKLRQSFDRTVGELIRRLQFDEGLRAQVETIKLEIAHNDLLSAYVQSLVGDLKEWLRHDLQQDGSKVREKIAEAIGGMAGALATNPELQESLNEHLEKLIITYGDPLRSAIAKHITETMQAWETEEYVNEIELSIGSDLQFIRMNGTLVGGLIGLVLHAIGLLLR
ncbi:MAG: DUF445 domain-containing protein [Deltaproteobacteria bacterium HGW-Deltaproteobacteria-4]|nr:MAG: DUF445 domain-containing protein [Deltaproteobacteria bacterium HGW-Deltaproteobacteria-4]